MPTTFGLSLLMIVHPRLIARLLDSRGIDVKAVLIYIVNNNTTRWVKQVTKEQANSSELLL